MMGSAFLRWFGVSLQVSSEGAVGGIQDWKGMTDVEGSGSEVI